MKHVSKHYPISITFLNVGAFIFDQGVIHLTKLHFVTLSQFSTLFSLIINRNCLSLSFSVIRALSTSHLSKLIAITSSSFESFRSYLSTALTDYWQEILFYMSLCHTCVYSYLKSDLSD